MVLASEGNPHNPHYSQLEMTIVKACNIPHLKTTLGTERKFYVTVADGKVTHTTKAVRGRQAVEWNEALSNFVVIPRTLIRLSLFAEHYFLTDELIGTCEITLKPQSAFTVVLDAGDEHSSQAITIHLGIAPSKVAMGLVTIFNMYGHAIVPPSQNKCTVRNNVPEPAKTTDQDKSAPRTTTCTYAPDCASSEEQPVERSASAHLQEVDLGKILDAASIAINNVETSDLCKNIVRTINRVLEFVGPLAELNLFSKMALDVIRFIPKQIEKGYLVDDNVRSLLVAIRDSFDLTQQAHSLKGLHPKSPQAKILSHMMEHVYNCSNFIKSYSCSTTIERQLLKARAEKQITEYIKVLGRLKETFLASATVAIQADVGNVALNTLQTAGYVRQVAADLQSLRKETSDIQLDAVIREIPYPSGARFIPDKGCLRGTRTTFLEYIIDWVFDPDSVRGLMLFGDAGTGKSAIAHEIARCFDEENLLTSSFIFVRSQEFRHHPYHLFTSLARDLADREPSFKYALGKALKDKTSCRGAQDYATLFRFLLLEPFKGLHIAGPIFVVIDGLDESGDASGRNGLHTFLAEHIAELPSNFRVLLTSRPEEAIKRAFDNAQSVKTIKMNDRQLSAKVDDDIRSFLKERLPPSIFGMYGETLVKNAEGLFQWAAVAARYVTELPPGCTEEGRIITLLDRIKTDGRLTILDSFA